MQRKDIFNKIKAATVAMGVMQTSDGKTPFTILGSGFCIDPSGIVVTCQHVLSAFMSKSIPDQIRDVDPDEKNKDVQKVNPPDVLEAFAIFYKAELIGHNLVVIPSKVDLMMAKTDYDLGVVRLLPHKHCPDGYPFIEIEDYQSLHEGQEVGLCGYPLGNFLLNQIGTVTSSFSTGILSSIIPSAGVDIKYLKGFQLNITATHGNSGGPVFSLETGNVFGVLQRGIFRDERQQQLFEGMVKAEPVYPILANDAIEMVKSTERGAIPDIEDFRRRAGSNST